MASIRNTCFHKNVYEPAEDSFALADTVVAYLKKIDERDIPHVVLEVGSGSGFVLASVAATLQSRAVYFATDLNPAAAAATAETLANHGERAEVVLTDLLDALGHRMEGAIDLLLFNPPYVPSPPEEVGSRSLPAAWAGGFRGRVVIDRFLPKVPGALSERGVCFMIAIAQNDVDELRGVAASLGLDCAVTFSTAADEERLYVLQLSKKGAAVLCD